MKKGRLPLLLILSLCVSLAFASTAFAASSGLYCPDRYTDWIYYADSSSTGHQASGYAYSRSENNLGQGKSIHTIKCNGELYIWTYANGKWAWTLADSANRTKTNDWYASITLELDIPTPHGNAKIHSYHYFYDPSLGTFDTTLIDLAG